MCPLACGVLAILIPFYRLFVAQVRRQENDRRDGIAANQDRRCTAVAAVVFNHYRGGGRSDRDGNATAAADDDDDGRRRRSGRDRSDGRGRDEFPGNGRGHRRHAGLLLRRA